MPARIVVFGATGYTGRLVVEALVRDGLRPVVAGRSAARLEELSQANGGLDVVVADVDRPATVAALVGAGDVLVSTVGPFARWGVPAVEAAIGAGATYLDSTGEPVFIRRVFEEFGPRAERGGSALVTAFAFDYVPGALAAEQAIARAGPRVVRVDIGYYVTGPIRNGASGGTVSSMLGAIRDPQFAFRDGRLIAVRGGSRVRSFMVAGERRPALSLGVAEHITVPRLHPELCEVNGYVGAFGPLTRPIQLGVAAGAQLGRLPGVSRAIDQLLPRLARGSSGGPDLESRRRTGSHVIAACYDADGVELSVARLSGPNGYTFTADILAWGAARAAEGGIRAQGALGPVEAFGLDALDEGCRRAGLVPAPH